MSAQDIENPIKLKADLQETALVLHAISISATINPGDHSGTDE